MPGEHLPSSAPVCCVLIDCVRLVIEFGKVKNWFLRIEMSLDSHESTVCVIL